MEKDNHEKIQTFFDEMFLSKTTPDKLTDEEEREQYFDVLLKEFYETKNMRLKSDLTKEQIFLLTRASVFADVYKSEIMSKTIEYILEYAVSKDRKGRLEFNEIFKFANDLKTDNLGYDNALANLLGFGRRV